MYIGGGSKERRGEGFLGEFWYLRVFFEYLRMIVLGYVSFLRMM